MKTIKLLLLALIVSGCSNGKEEFDKACIESGRSAKECAFEWHRAQAAKGSDTTIINTGGR